MTLTPTPSQTVGPFFSFGLCERPCSAVVEPGSPNALELGGRVLDGAGEPVPDAVVEIWQADVSGEYRPGFGWGRCGTDPDGRYRFTTVEPGVVDGQAPHLVVLVFARGLLKPVLTRIYFPGNAGANERDPVLSSLGDPAALVAVLDGDSLRFDVHLQGDRQTPFFAL
ncbi:MAG: protocatechuate 3,4-dioxygenase subunit alpha [Gaiellaceae bacterium]